MTIYTSQLHSGDWYVQTTTDAPNREVYAVLALGRSIFATRAEALDAVEQADRWARENLWIIRATDRATGQDFDCFTWIRCPRDGITRAMMDAREFGRDCYGFHAVPAGAA